MEKNMRLGIVVVYLVNEKDEKLLDLHLTQIEKHTTIPYTIFGSANRLLPKFKDKLEHNSNVKLCELPTTELREGDEHVFYLNHLIQMAIKDGVSHIATMHADSFPVITGWAEKLIDTLHGSCVLAGIMREENNDRTPNSACMLFHRDFYLKYNPQFQLSEAERSSTKYKEYLRKYHHFHDAGTGYGFKIYSEGLTWYPLLRSNKGSDHNLIGNIYGDLVFHLLAAARNEKLFYGDRITSIRIGRVRVPVGFIRRAVSIVLPASWKNIMKGFYGWLSSLRTSRSSNEAAHELIKKQLFEDPDSYLGYLRTGLKRSKVHKTGH